MSTHASSQQTWTRASCSCTFIFSLLIHSEFSPTGDYLPALPVGGAPPSSGSRGPAVGGDRPVVLGGHGSPLVPDAYADHVRSALLKVQVTHSHLF